MAETALDSTFLIFGQTVTAPRLEPGLYLVATPIGNLGDITLRALQSIAGADLLACEDTRVTGKLLQRYGIRRKMAPYHEHNAADAGQQLLAEIEAGRAVALVSDAGMPLISDPGFSIAREAMARGLPVYSIPGASASLTALSVSGLPSDAFFFAGFLPQKQSARRQRLQELLRVPGTLIFFEAPHRISESLADMAAVLGERPAAVCRELTKMHETIYRATLAELAEAFPDLDRIRGEIVVCVAPPAEEELASGQDADTILAGLLREMKPAQAAQEAVKLTGLPRRALYQRALELKNRPT